MARKKKISANAQLLRQVIDKLNIKDNNKDVADVKNLSQNGLKILAKLLKIE